MMGDLILIDRSAMLEAIDKRERIVRKFAPNLQEDEIRPTLKSIREFIANRPISMPNPCGTERGKCAARRFRQTMRHIRRVTNADTLNPPWIKLRRTARCAGQKWTEDERKVAHKTGRDT